MNKYHNVNVSYIKSISLKVKDIEVSLKFYKDVLGFNLISSNDNIYNIGVGNDILVSLIEDKASITRKPTTGLYHFAILLPNRKYLGQLINHFIKINQKIVGGTHHGVSEALYLSDPDGNGIEIYSDTDDSTWEYDKEEIIMVSDPLDYASLIQDTYQALWTTLPEGTIMGHLHFHVNDLVKANNFFIDIIGLNQMLYYGQSALFLSHSDYHHHVGLNTWAGTSVLNKPDNMVGLESYTMNFNDVDEFKQRLLDNQIEILTDGTGNYIIDINNVKVYF